MSGNNGSMPTAVEFIRGETVESIHGGVAVVVDHTGRIIAQFGDADFVTFSRSSLKPLQALAAVERGVIEHWGLHERHLAIMCGSHSGEEIHVTTAREILDRIGCTDADYQCGVHVPTYFRLTNGNNPIPARGDFTQLHNNCSGKHAGMLAFSRFLNADIGHYLELDHPVQVAIRESIAQYS
ncbi:MAG TPA: asparaginase, partial [candidate division Zixibacteria bacterium]|nr:asparaginase [candidate division Zixibacteria bacterium]